MSQYQQSFDETLMIENGKHTYVKFSYVKYQIKKECIIHKVLSPYFLPRQAKKNLLKTFPLCKLVSDRLNFNKFDDTITKIN